MGSTKQSIFYDIAIASEQTITLVVFNALVCLSNIVVNSLLIYAIWKLKLLGTISYRFIVCLSISDICIAVFLQPLTGVNLLISGTVESRLTAQFFSFSFCHFSGVMIVIITLDRYTHMKYLQMYGEHMTSRRAALLIGGNILLSLSLAIAYIFSTIYRFFFYLNITFIIIDFFVLFTSFILYMKTFLNIRRQTAALQFSSEVSNNVKRTKRRDLQFAKGVIIVCVLLAIDYLPYFLLSGIASYQVKVEGKQPSKSLVTLVYWSYIFVYINCSTNAVVFIMFNKAIRNLTKQCIFSGLVNSNTDTSTTVTAGS